VASLPGNSVALVVPADSFLASISYWLLNLLLEVWEAVVDFFQPDKAFAGEIEAQAASDLSVMTLQESIPSGQVWKTYYYAGSQRVAMRVNDGETDEVYYLFGDHLGSTSITTDSEGNLYAELRYTAWGTVRYANGEMLTDYTYTGQRSEVSNFGLMYYNARWYEPALGRFVEADTIVPEPGNPLGWDRFAYTRNNPVRYTDPSGHDVCDEEGNCYTTQGWYRASTAARLSTTETWKMMIRSRFGILMSDGVKNWDARNLRLMYRSLGNIDTALNGRTTTLIGGATFKWDEYEETEENCPKGGCTYMGWTKGTTVTFFTEGDSIIRQMNIYHEVGHVLDNKPGRVDFFSDALNDAKDRGFVGDNGYIVAEALIEHPYVSTDLNYSSVKSIQASKASYEEVWADAFANHVAGNINLREPAGQDMYNFVTGALRPYIGAP
jgi:RHS repeat-associated protein